MQNNSSTTYFLMNQYDQYKKQNSDSEGQKQYRDSTTRNDISINMIKKPNHNIIIQRREGSLLYNHYKLEMGKRPIQSIPLKYHKITYEQRLQLIDSVLVKGLSISQSSKIVGVKFSTAKLIIKRYKQTGTVFETKQERSSRAQSPPEPIQPPIHTDEQIVEKDSPEEKNGKENLVEEQKFIPFYFSLPPIYYYASFNTPQPFFGTFTTN